MVVAVVRVMPLTSFKTVLVALVVQVAVAVVQEPNQTVAAVDLGQQEPQILAVGVAVAVVTVVVRLVFLVLVAVGLLRLGMLTARQLLLALVLA